MPREINGATYRVWIVNAHKIEPVQIITDSIDSRTEYLNYLPLRLTTVTDCIRRHLLVNPTIPYYVVSVEREE